MASYSSVRNRSSELNDYLEQVNQLIRFSFIVLILLTLGSGIAGFSLIKIADVGENYKILTGDHSVNILMATLLIMTSFFIAFVGLYGTISSAKKAVKLTSRFAEKGLPRVNLIATIQKFKTWLQISQWLMVGYLLLVLADIIFNWGKFNLVAGIGQGVHALISLVFCVAYWIFTNSLQAYFARVIMRSEGQTVFFDIINEKLNSNIAMVTLVQKIHLFIIGVGLIAFGAALAFYPEASELIFSKEVRKLNFVAAVMSISLGIITIWIDIVLINTLNNASLFIRDASEIFDHRLRTSEAKGLTQSFLM